MELIRALLEQQPLMALFLTIAIGYLVGEINIKGFSLGVGAVLFVALGIAWSRPRPGRAPGGGAVVAGALGRPVPRQGRGGGGGWGRWVRRFPAPGGGGVRQAVLHRTDEP